ncbi:MAG: Oligopeptide transport ATP-binding protein OppF [Syntrophorhabdus sp. PtaU1.Bin058]|nr:MAG: Oligopeptide transport ATP-binding protein OppF [Syntrophorhabdus sp. PtaU1.Bin058]
MGQVLSVLDLQKVYEVKRSAFSVQKDLINALCGVSLELDKGKTTGIVGESGSGKSTLARCILLLERPDGGTISFLGRDLLNMPKGELKALRRQMQIIFQDPYSSLNPRKRIFDTIAEPLLFHGIVDRRDVKDKVMEILKNVGLDEDFINKYPHEMSGGQRQRVAIGRSLTTDPALIIADEPVSSLDVSIQAQIVNLFLDIKERTDIAMLFVSHDLNVVRFVSDEIVVMYKGRVVEAGLKDEVFLGPLHPYTKMLINAAKGEYSRREEDTSYDKGNGCPYYARCEERKDCCRESVPPLTGSKDHSVACFSVS